MADDTSTKKMSGSTGSILRPKLRTGTVSSPTVFCLVKQVICPNPKSYISKLNAYLSEVSQNQGEDNCEHQKCIISSTCE